MNTTQQDVERLVAQLAVALIARGWLMATAESCTGGLISAACTDRAGSSAWFDRGFVTYSNQAKAQMLGVDAGLIALKGAVSQEVAHAMAEGAVARSGANAAVAVTGVAGPTGGSAAKPVGTVWFSVATPDGVVTETRRFEGDRAAVRLQTVAQALQMLIAALKSPTS